MREVHNSKASAAMSNKKTPSVPAPGQRRPRPKRSELSTATAVSGGKKDKEPPLFDPFQDGAVPLQPEDFVSEHRHDGRLLEFKYDDFLTTRRVARRNVHGDIETRFDPETLVPSAGYLRKIAEQNVLEQVDVDEAVEREMLAGVVEQPQEIQEQLRRDLQNPKFLDAITKTVVRSKKASAAAAANGDASSERIEPVRWEAASDAANNPDFFTHVETFDGYDTLRAHMRKRRRERRFEQLAAEAAKDSDADADDREVESKSGEDDAEASEELDVGQFGTILSDAQARDLVQINPFASLRMAARCDLMRVVDVASIYRLLYPLVMRHERHRTHFNIVELVREMSVRGAKYDGCVQVRSKRRLGALLDRGFYESFYADETSDRLLGGHEHYQPASHTTRFCVFKFFLVQRNAENCALLQIVDETSRRHAHSNRAARLNAGGAYDVDQTARDTEKADSYGSMHDIEHLHREFMLCLRLVCVECNEDARVTREPTTDAEDEDSETSCASVADDEFEEPAEFEPRRVRRWRAQSQASESTSRSHASAHDDLDSVDLSGITLDDNTTDSATIAPDGLLSSESSTSRVRRVQIETSASNISNSSSAQANSATPASASSLRLSGASDLDELLDDEFGDDFDDDDDDDDEPDTNMVLDDIDAMPTNHVMLNHKRAAQLVGKPRSAAFLQRVNARSIGVLCPRAFMLYAVDPLQK